MKLTLPVECCVAALSSLYEKLPCPIAIKVINFNGAEKGHSYVW